MVENSFYNRVFVVIPAFNEATTIVSVIENIKKYVTHVIVVDDASRDQTAILAEKAGADVLHHIINRGQGAALKTGIDYALRCGAEVMVTFDADGQHEASEIPLLVEPILHKEVDVVLGSRFLNGTPQTMPWMRRIMLRCAIIFTKVFSSIHVTDTHNGFRAFSRHAVQTIRIHQDRMEHASEIIDEIASHKLRFMEVPITITYSPYSLKKGQRISNFAKIGVKLLLRKIISF